MSLRIVVGIVTAAMAASALADDTPPLAHNPFDRPSMQAATEVEETPEASEAHTEDPLELRATMVAGPRSMVNVAGEIVELGDAVSGYRLTEVREGEATLVRDGRSVVLRFNDPDREGITDEE